MFATTKASGVSEGPSDPYFNAVTLLLPGNGTNGAQNNTFVDSSVNNFTISRAGTATQGTFSPFSHPAGYWSTNFNGTSGYITFPNSANFAFGTGAFTIEFWINTSTLQNDKFLLSGRASIGTMHITTGGAAGSTAGALRYVGSSTITSGTTLISDGTWHHCAIVRGASNNVVLYVDGVSRGTGTDTTNYTTTTGTWFIASNDTTPPANLLQGTISNLRIVKGTAVYTAAFTPPTVPLTAITNTSLLTFQSNGLLDASSSPVALTVIQGPAVILFNPFLPTSAYSPSANGGSTYLDGSSYLTVPDNAAFAFGSGDFTIEAWIYGTTFNSFNDIVTKGAAGVFQPYYVLVTNTGSLRFYSSSNGSSWDIANNVSFGTVSTNTWNHVAISRSGTSIRLFLNGVLATTITTSAALTVNTRAVAIGARSDGTEIFTGYISGVRLVKGTALYTATFTLPTAPPTPVTNTVLLTNFTNAGVFDNAAMSDLVTVGTAQISTAQAKFGTGSISFNGSGSYLQIPSGPVFNFGAANFTIEFWLYPNSLANSPAIITKTAASGSNIGWFIEAAADTIYFGYGTSGGQFATFSGTLPTSAWTYIAVTRVGGALNCFFNGISAGAQTGFSTGAIDNTNPLLIGRGFGSAASDLNGYLDEVRVTVGIARYTANFTPPTAAFPNQ